MRPRFDNTTTPPTAHEWSEFGKTRQQVVGDSGSGIETPGLFTRLILGLGERFGSARIDRGRALGVDASPNRMARAGGDLREAVVRENGELELMAPKATIAKTPALRDAAIHTIEVLRRRLERLTVSVRPAAEAAVEAARARAARTRAALDRLSNSQRGYIGHVAVVVAVALGVPLFDIAIIHAALERAGLSLFAMWGTTITVPIAIWAINHALGLVAGAIALRMPSERTRLAVIAFVAGGGALLAAFATLAVFRHQSTTSQNEALGKIAAGDFDQQVEFFLSPLWMGPLQVAASIAAIVVVALWTVSKPGRDCLKHVDVAIAELAAAEAELSAVDSFIETTHLELERAEVAPFEITAKGKAAEVEVEARKQALVAQRDQERALARMVSSRYEAEFEYTDKIYANGGVWRCAMATVERLISRHFTPAPTDRPAAPDGQSAAGKENEHAFDPVG